MNEQILKRSWATIQFELTSELEDLAPRLEIEEMATWLMFQNGATACEVKSGDRNQQIIEATFPNDSLSLEELIAIKASMEEFGLSSSLRSLRVSSVQEQDWLKRWKEGFEPFVIGKKLGICPPWLKDELDQELMKGRHVIYIEPGMAFGTGLHATTQYCMTAIENESEISDALDVGTGSGILAIAAALLNKSCKILAVDNDPESVRTANLNTQINNVSDQIEVILGTTASVRDRKFNHIFSNMTCEDIIALLPEYERLIEPSGVVFCAGVLTEKRHLLDKALAERGWKVLHAAESGIWTGLTVGARA
jgi:ribosomal protein L11 methyltransferase